MPDDDLGKVCSAFLVDGVLHKIRKDNEARQNADAEQQHCYDREDTAFTERCILVSFFKSLFSLYNGQILGGGRELLADRQRILQAGAAVCPSMAYSVRLVFRFSGMGQLQ